MADILNRDSLKQFSNLLADAVELAAEGTVLVSSGDDYPSSGTWFESDYVLTTSQAVRPGDEVKIMLPDGEYLSGTTTGFDPAYDLALVKVDQGKGRPLRHADGALRTGQMVLALARPSDEGIQASLGIVGIADGRYRMGPGLWIEGVMRTDAPRFPGFEGGPLIDTEGMLVGINILGRHFGSSLTIPTEKAWQIAARLKTGIDAQRGYLGIRSQLVQIPESARIKDTSTGLLVVGIEDDSAAKKAGLMVGDILVGFDGSTVADHEDLLGKLTESSVGKTVDIEIIRGGNRQNMQVAVEGRAVSAKFQDHKKRHHGRPSGHHHRG